jgi:hypothetical protein
MTSAHAPSTTAGLRAQAGERENDPRRADARSRTRLLGECDHRAEALEDARADRARRQPGPRRPGRTTGLRARPLERVFDEAGRHASGRALDMPANDAPGERHRQFVARVCHRMLGTVVDAVFTGEDYGQPLLGAESSGKTFIMDGTAPHLDGGSLASALARAHGPPATSKSTSASAGSNAKGASTSML